MAELVWKKKPRTQPVAREATETLQVSAGPQFIIDHAYPIPTSPSSSTPSEAAAWHNRLILGDTSAILPALQPEFAGRVKLVYIDPPFMTGRTFSHGDLVAYKDTWRNSLDTYLQWLYEVLNQLHVLLASDGSLYLHLDWRATHYAKVILDEIFGFHPLLHGPGFKNEIIWHYQSGGRAQKYYARKHDTILLYTKSAEYCFHSERIAQKRGAHKRNHMRKEVGEDGKISWTIRSGGRLYRYHEDAAMSTDDVWHDISHLHQKDPERTGYATQKPEALLERILLASSEEQDLVLDCFCGSGVTPAVAERLGRRWIACDKSEAAITITRERLLKRGPQQPFAVQHISASEKDNPI